MKPTRPIVVFTCFVLAMLAVLSSNKLRSNASAPPPDFANNPPIPLNCASTCHDGTPTADASIYTLEMGIDSNSFNPVVSNVTTYDMGGIYYLRVTGTRHARKYGFELTALDSTNAATNVGTFVLIDGNNTSLQNIIYPFVGHKSAGIYHQWTFQWVAPTNYHGPITFYWCGNNANGDGTNKGDTVYTATATIHGVINTAINPIASYLGHLKLFPTVCNSDFQFQFNLLKDENLSAEILSVNGEAVKPVLNENLNAGNYQRTVDVSNLSAGIYLLKLQVNDGFVVRKFVKQ